MTRATDYDRMIMRLALRQPECTESLEAVSQALTPSDLSLWAGVHGGAVLVDVVSELATDRRYILDEEVAAAFAARDPAPLGKMLLKKVRARALKCIRADLDREIDRRMWRAAEAREGM